VPMLRLTFTLHLAVATTRGSPPVSTPKFGVLRKMPTSENSNLEIFVSGHSRSSDCGPPPLRVWRNRRGYGVVILAVWDAGSWFGAKVQQTFVGDHWCNKTLPSLIRLACNSGSFGPSGGSPFKRQSDSQWSRYKQYPSIPV